MRGAPRRSHCHAVSESLALALGGCEGGRAEPWTLPHGPPAERLEPCRAAWRADSLAVQALCLASRKPRDSDSDRTGRCKNSRCLVSIHYAVLIAFYIVTHLIFTASLDSECEDHHPHFIDWTTEMQRSYICHPKSHSSWATEPGFEPWRLSSMCQALMFSL